MSSKKQRRNKKSAKQHKQHEPFSKLELEFFERGENMEFEEAPEQATPFWRIVSVVALFSVVTPLLLF